MVGHWDAIVFHEHAEKDRNLPSRLGAIVNWSHGVPISLKSGSIPTRATTCKNSYGNGDIIMGNIGEPRREIELEPLEEPVESPVEAPVRKEPVPA